MIRLGIGKPRYGTSFFSNNRLQSTTPLPRRRTRLRNLRNAAGYTVLAGGGIFVYDKFFNATAIGRNVRTLSTGFIMAADYKLNFNESNSAAIPALQERVAERLYNLLVSNGGLYIKIGQMIGANAAILPEPFQKRFGRLFDDAPQIPFEDVEMVIKREFGVSSVDDVFDDFERTAVASASVAQVHRARLKRTGERVAVKIQKPAVTKQVNWDLFGYKCLMWCYDKIFPLPVYFLADFVTSHLRRELDFQNEALNAIRTTELINDPKYAMYGLKNRVYIPKVYLEHTTRAVMTAEWIDGIRLSKRGDVAQFVEGKILPLGSEDLGGGEEKVRRVEKPQPMNGGTKAIMQTMVDLFSAQMFGFGFIHCDPHPGNILLRPRPGSLRETQLVLLDHGLYVTLNPEFRAQYATLWRSLLTLDWPTIREIGEEWGIGSPDLLGSATLMRPVRLNSSSSNKKQESEEPEKKLSNYELAERMREKLKTFLTDADKMPKELVFIGRNMRIVQGNNQSLGSPVNRVRITASWASRSLVFAPPLNLSKYPIPPSNPSYFYQISHSLKQSFNHLTFLTLLFSMDLAFYASKFRQWIRGSEEGWEDELEAGMKGFAKDNFGVELGKGAFEG